MAVCGVCAASVASFARRLHALRHADTDFVTCSLCDYSHRSSTVDVATHIERSHSDRRLRPRSTIGEQRDFVLALERRCFEEPSRKLEEPASSRKIRKLLTCATCGKTTKTPWNHAAIHGPLCFLHCGYCKFKAKWGGKANIKTHQNRVHPGLDTKIIDNRSKESEYSKALMRSCFPTYPLKEETQVKQKDKEKEDGSENHSEEDNESDSKAQPPTRVVQNRKLYTCTKCSKVTARPWGHAGTHGTRFLIHCGYCKVKAKWDIAYMRKHLNVAHSGLAVKITDDRAREREYLKSLVRACFPTFPIKREKLVTEKDKKEEELDSQPEDDRKSESEEPPKMLVSEGRTVHTCTLCDKTEARPWEHALSHGPRYLIHCGHCAFKVKWSLGNMKKHHNRDHAGLEIKITDDRSKEMEYSKALVSSCFPTLPIREERPDRQQKDKDRYPRKDVSTNLKGKRSDTCFVCQNVFKSGWTLRMQHSASHGPLYLLHCGYCKFKNKNSMSNMRRHLRTAHPKLKRKITDNRHKHSEYSKELFRSCFPLKEYSPDETGSQRTRPDCSKPAEAEASKVHQSDDEEVGDDEGNAMLTIPRGKRSRTCTVCHKENKGGFWEHAARHGHLFLFHCGYCKYKTKGSLHSITRHQYTVHPKLKRKIIDNRSKHRDYTEELLRSCFPLKEETPVKCLPTDPSIHPTVQPTDPSMSEGDALKLAHSASPIPFIKRRLPPSHFRCGRCGEAVERRMARAHVEGHSERGLFTCPTCGRDMRSRAAVDVHYRSCHPNRMPQIVPVNEDYRRALEQDCLGYSMGREESPERSHDSLPSIEPRSPPKLEASDLPSLTESKAEVPCVLCPTKVADSFPAKVAHAADHNTGPARCFPPALRPPCTICGTELKLKDFSARMRHAATHVPQLPLFACPLCSFSCYYSDPVKGHILKVHKRVEIAILDQRSKYREEIQAIVRECFPLPS